jgi:hypothetical protein
VSKLRANALNSESESDIIQEVVYNFRDCALNTNIHNYLLELYKDIYLFFSANHILIYTIFIMLMLPCAMFLVNLILDHITTIIRHLGEKIFSLIRACALIVQKFAGNNDSEKITKFFSRIKNYTGKDRNNA